MKFLRIHNNDSIKGGAEYHVYKLWRIFTDAGVKNDVLAIVGHRPPFKVVLNFDSVLHESISPEELITFLDEYLRRTEPDFVHIHSMAHVFLIKHLLGKLPVFRSMHEPMLICPGRSKFLAQSELPCRRPFGLHCFYHAYTERCATRRPLRLIEELRRVHTEVSVFSRSYREIFVVSNYLKREAVFAGVSESKLRVMPSPQLEKAISAKEPLAESNSIRLIFVGRLSPTKGCVLLLHALSLLCRKGEDLVLDIVGDGSQEAPLKQYAHEAGISKQVNFHGWQAADDVGRFYKLADISIVPSIYPDAFPNVVAESMMYGLPVVTFREGGTTEWFEEGDSGFSVETGNVEALAGKILELVRNPELRMRMGRNARARIMELYSPERALSAYTDAYFKGLAG